MIFPTRDQIVRLNRRHLEIAGTLYVQPDNLRNSSSLEWVLDVIQYPLFGVDHYPTLAEKGACLAWTIITGHVFHDGNKRTGMSAMDVFIRQNGYQLSCSNEEIVEIALRIAARNTPDDYTLDEFVEWVRSKLIPLSY